MVSDWSQASVIVNIRMGLEYSRRQEGSVIAMLTRL